MSKFQETGMDLLDYFAAKAMQAILSNNEFLIHASNYDEENGSEISIAKLAYEQAIAMMRVRK